MKVNSPIDSMADYSTCVPLETLLTPAAFVVIAFAWCCARPQALSTVF
jgi:hypothetical protein